MIVGIDPGTKACGAGVLDAVNRLQSAKLVQAKGPDQLAVGVLDYVTDCLRIGGPGGSSAVMFITPLHVLIEYPQAYQPGQQDGDQNDLLRVALVAGACGGAIRSRFAHATIEYVLPRNWKGTIDADVFTNRIAGRLEPSEERAIIRCIPSLMHNVYDGIGLALHAAGRMARRRVYE